MAKPKPSRRRKIIFILVICIAVIIGILLCLKKAVFLQCVEHVDYSSTHTHTQLTIKQDGKKIAIPADIGITDKCMHPLHTHDTTGLIHMEYPLPVPFTLGDFFDVMGVTFDDRQIGAIKKYDGYDISVIKNGQEVTSQFRWILLKDLDKIEIEVNKKR